MHACCRPSWTKAEARARISSVIEKLWLQNFGCVKEAEIGLTPIHVLIGPNDSGKSTILRAVEGLASFAAGSPLPDKAWALLREPGASVEGGHSRGHLGVKRTEAGLFEVAGHTPEPTRGKLAPAAARIDRGFSAQKTRELPDVFSPVAKSFLVRFEPDQLRQRTGLLPDTQPIRFLDEKGLGLPAVYDALVNREVESFLAIGRKVQDLFPSVKSLSLKNPSGAEKALAIRLQDGQEVGADMMSEGLLYYLAFAVLPYLEPVAVILVEEPENGLHPARITEVMATLREISKTTQVLIATHSPLVVNEMRPDEVSIVTRTAALGTKVTRLPDTQGFEKRTKLYAPGEMWLNYANGTDESPLLNGGPRP